MGRLVVTAATRYQYGCPSHELLVEFIKVTMQKLVQVEDKTSMSGIYFMQFISYHTIIVSHNSYHTIMFTHMCLICI